MEGFIFGGVAIAILVLLLSALSWITDGGLAKWLDNRKKRKQWEIEDRQKK
jgi:predicted membrane-bound dolichyl-phosphate-mannose-protein mannosyltransferase